MLDVMSTKSLSTEIMLVLPSYLHSLGSSASLKRSDVHNVIPLYDRFMEDYLKEVRRSLNVALDPCGFLEISRSLQAQFRARLRSDPYCMLPSYNHTLPNGDERGSYVVLDVGGSTLRVALVKLSGRSSADDPMRIVRMETSYIDSSVKALRGLAFFDWLAAKVEHMLAKGNVRHESDAEPLPIGLAWSFPIAQTSIRTGSLLGMGKGFACSSGVSGLDLGEVIQEACQRRNLNVRIGAMVNDSCATLLSSAYLDDSTSLALIFGTGMNAAVHLPVTALGPDKFGSRPHTWHAEAEYVLVNTELSMFGKNILPATRWDEEINACNDIPDYQPFEYLISGRHMGELVRLILAEIAAETGFLGGSLPTSLSTPYSLCTETIATIEADDTPTLSKASSYLREKYAFHPSPTPDDLRYIQTICRLVSRRATLYLATGIHALWKLQIDHEGLDPRESGHVSIACNGSVINKYPGFFRRCQECVDAMTEAEGFGRGRVVLEPAFESAIRGAAVAVALAEAEAEAESEAEEGSS